MRSNGRKTCPRLRREQGNHKNILVRKGSATRPHIGVGLKGSMVLPWKKMPSATYALQEVKKLVAGGGSISRDLLWTALLLWASTIKTLSSAFAILWRERIFTKRCQPARDLA